MQIGIAQLDGVEVVALGDEEIFPAIVVIVEETDAPPRVGHGEAGDTGSEAGVSKSGVAIVLVEGVALVGEIRDDQIGPAIVIIIGEIDTHASVSAAVAVNGDFGEEADFFEGAVAFVVIEKFDHGVVGDEEVNVAVAVVIGESDAQGFAGLREAVLLRDFRKVAVAIVVIDERRNGLKNVGVTIGAVALFVFAAPDIVEIPLEVAEDHEVKQAVVV